MLLPFTESAEGGDLLRSFSEDVDKFSLKWHRDPEDRLIEPTGFTDWKIQLEDGLPEYICKEVFIPKCSWHRLIKGTDKLIIKLTKI